MATYGKKDMDIYSDETFDVLCSVCKKKGKNTEAEKFCADCNVHFCINCVQVHSQVPVCSDHKVLDKSQIKPGTSKISPRAPAERCDKHSYKHIDMYCQNHDNVGCSTCMAVDHRSCKDTFYIPEFIQNNTYQTASRDIEKKLEETAKNLAEQVTKLKQVKQSLVNRKEEILDEIRKFRQEINNQLDNLEKISVDEIEDKVKHLEDKIEEALKQLQANKAKIASVTDKLSSQNTSQAEVFVNVKTGVKAANIAKKLIEDINIKNSVYDIEFQQERTILTMLQQDTTLGTLIERTTKTSDTLFQIKGYQSYSVKVDSDEKENSLIASACFMADGTIIMANHNNKKIKRLQRDKYTITDCLDLPGPPKQLAKISEMQVAVTIPSQKQVHFINLGRQMTTRYKIDTDFECYGLAYRNYKLYISDRDTSVYIYALSGMKLVKLSQFRLDQSDSGYSIFSKVLSNAVRKMLITIHSLAVSKDASRIYVADDKNGLTILDNSGQVIATFTNPQLRLTASCYLTEAGSLLVSGLTSAVVIQIKSNGEMIGEIIKEDSEKLGISSVCCNQQMSKMIICRMTGKNIEVYDI